MNVGRGKLKKKLDDLISKEKLTEANGEGIVVQYRQKNDREGDEGRHIDIRKERGRKGEGKWWGQPEKEIGEREEVEVREGGEITDRRGRGRG